VLEMVRTGRVAMARGSGAGVASGSGGLRLRPKKDFLTACRRERRAGVWGRVRRN
jgi:hypothetical protein